MKTPPRQIGWSTEEILIWTVSKQLEQLIAVVGANAPVTTSTTTTTP